MIISGDQTVDRAAFLARASAVLSASLEYEATLQQVARLAVPFISDGCSIDILRSDGSIERVARAHASHERETLFHDLNRSFPYDLETPYGPPNVIRTGVAEVYPEVTPEMMDEAIADEARLQSVVDLGIRSAIIVPLKAREKILGAISFITDSSRRTLDHEDLPLAEDLAARASLALDNARLFEDAQEAIRVRDDALHRSRTSEEQLLVLTEASNTVLNSLDLQSVLPAVLDLSQKLIQADGYGVWKLDRSTDSWRIMASAGLSESYLSHSRDLPKLPSMPSTPIVAEDAQSEPALLSRRKLYEQEGIKSLLIVPLRIQGEVEGTIAFYFRHSVRFERSDVQLASALANIAASAIGAAELFEAESRARAYSETAETAYREAAAEAELLHRAGRLLGSTLDTNRIYSTLRSLIAEIMDCDGLLISSYDSADNLIRCAYAWVEGNEIDHASLPPIPLAPEGKGLQSKVIRTGEPMIITDFEAFSSQSHTSFHVQPDGSYGPRPLESKPKTQSAIYAPIKLEGQVLGIIQVQSLKPDAFSSHHLHMLEALMLQVAAAGRNAYLYQQARAELVERRRAEDELERKQADIEALNERLQRAMTETHHRVKNNLQIIAAMVDMQLLERPDSVPASQVKRLGSYVITLAAVHDILTQESKEDSQAQFASTRAVFDKLIPLMENSAQGRQITFGVDDIRLSAKQGTALALVVNELINNAFKHGALHVDIELRQIGEGMHLKVLDDGPGFPPGFSPEMGSHTGIELIESLSRWDLQGATSYENRPQGGASVTVLVPQLSYSEPQTPAAITG